LSIWIGRLPSKLWFSGRRIRRNDNHETTDHRGPWNGQDYDRGLLTIPQGYEHLDAEDIPRSRLEEFASCLFAFANKPGEQKVITWGFQPGSTHDLFVAHLQAAGFRMIWFDGKKLFGHRIGIAPTQLRQYSNSDEACVLLANARSQHCSADHDFPNGFRAMRASTHTDILGI